MVVSNYKLYYLSKMKVYEILYENIFKINFKFYI